MHLFTVIPTPGSTSDHYKHVYASWRMGACALYLCIFASTCERARSLSLSLSLYTLTHTRTHRFQNTFAHTSSKIRILWKVVRKLVLLPASESFRAKSEHKR